MVGTNLCVIRVKRVVVNSLSLPLPLVRQRPTAVLLKILKLHQSVIFLLCFVFYLQLQFVLYLVSGQNG